MNRSKLFSTVSAALLSCSITLMAENWPHWRGPHFNGSVDEKNLPSTFSKTENVLWSLDMPGPSAATPIVWGDHVFLSSTDDKTKTLRAMCIDRKTGKVKWNNEAAVGFQRDNRSNFASPSPVTDGKRVIFFYGTGDLVAYDFDGKQIWTRNIQKDHGDFAFQWTFSTSPTIHGGKLYMQVLQRNKPVNGRGRPGAESFLLACDPASGKELWKHIRPSDAVEESLEAFTTPVPNKHGGREEILIAGGDCITGHDPENGKELWRWGTWNPTKIGHWRLVPSPVAGDGIILACAPKGSPIYAVPAGKSGTLKDADLAWTSDVRSDEQRMLTSDVPTPLFYKNDFFILSDVKKGLSRVEPKTGKVKWSIELPGRAKYEASPAGADNKIYLMNFVGDVVVVNAEDGKIVGTAAMGESGDDMTRSSIIISQGQVFVRTNAKLFCIGAK